MATAVQHIGIYPPSGLPGSSQLVRRTDRCVSAHLVRFVSHRAHPSSPFEAHNAAWSSGEPSYARHHGGFILQYRSPPPPFAQLEPPRFFRNFFGDFGGTRLCSLAPRNEWYTAERRPFIMSSGVRPVQLNVSRSSPLKYVAFNNRCLTHVPLR